MIDSPSNNHLIHAFGGKLVGTSDAKKLVAETILLLPKETIDYLLEHCWFLSSDEDAWAYAFRGDDAVGQYFIFLSDALLDEPEDQIRYTLLHEIGHVMLKHRNSVGTQQAKGEIDKQEHEADQFAKQYLSTTPKDPHCFMKESNKPTLEQLLENVSVEDVSGE